MIYTYLVIDEDMTVSQTTEITNDDKEAVADGRMDVFCFSETQKTFLQMDGNGIFTEVDKE